MNNACAEFDSLWTDFLRAIESQLLATRPADAVFDPATYHPAIRAELDHWFQPEHRWGAWTRAFSARRPEAAAAFRQRLTSIQLPDRAFWIGPHRLSAAVSYAASAASLALAPEVGGKVAKGVALIVVWAAIAAISREIRHRRRRRAVKSIQAGLERDGALLRKLLEDS